MNYYPKLIFRPGKGFDHDIMIERTSEVYARLYGDKLGEQLGRLFVAAPALAEATHQAFELIEADHETWRERPQYHPPKVVDCLLKLEQALQAAEKGNT